MSEGPTEPEPEDVTIEITVDASRAIRALENAHSAIMFATHPDLNGTSALRPDEEPTP
ncbi:hypothetical protein ACIRU8_39420 [Streptomyces sp. NPDC101175]|uniref:hypothetical protein n=1 Tax=Streptomyces sp. NPDC101175 TaxID=3366123 RepID=UPI00383716AC